MNKITIIPISILRIELSNMSSLLASVLNELQWFLEILVPNAIILLRIESSFTIRCESKTCRRRRVKLEAKIIFLNLKGESKTCIEKQESSHNLKLEL